MEKTKRKSKNKNTFYRVLSYLLVLSTILAFGFVIYFEVLPITYISLSIIAVGLVVFFLFKKISGD